MRSKLGVEQTEDSVRAGCGTPPLAEPRSRYMRQRVFVGKRLTANPERLRSAAQRITKVFPPSRRMNAWGASTGGPIMVRSGKPPTR